MICLGIESSCDETSVALVDGTVLLGQLTFSQVDMHSVFGGVVPEMASREHLNKVAPLYQNLLRDTGIRQNQINVVAVARGPGLLGCLLVGISFAKGLCLSLNIPLVGVNHLHAHLMAPGMEQELNFPAIGLLVSGGHTSLYLINSPFDFKLLGKTLDDAAGEAFDKAAKSLNIPYPGGIFIDRFASFAQPDHKMFPRPYLDNTNLDFSFSGIKTAMVYHVRDNPGLVLQNPTETGPDFKPSEELATVCSSYNWSIADSLRIKLKRALDRHEVKEVILAGGVAANTMIRESISRLAMERKIRLIMPSIAMCTDNAAMIALYGHMLYTKGYHHSLNLEAVPRGRKIPWDYITLMRDVPTTQFKQE
ncbi:tRNA (adenosine(37)-N6)-threonylcarbamoyltransferase complex transferase subunit TsaD [Desulfonatronovibrio magnus]|uniref:tRNA (adenosine(37)-N6)-threonylcarbamoyltransferase complex transferase subunit TsaD n=1 Tax=Desulfonatronovibrio magnus TaxID=698827 RepID=UPI0005EB8C67|nr:tRNA (adenosine(37)-N6)-threonylcarbamoyltransferase complex transferase subunit TsaD [Desulfonatronovibrio magnus]RQD56922.1 MAG: tRNA (adenosine(37)-N6)-threonylcarbamoyltransferase complex transferase subunit TsaD [Desulfonatronovibrio sp. MSAO_Bac4]